MFNLFQSLIKAEHPDYIIDTRTSAYEELRVAACAYAKNRRYYVATTFYTDAWISKYPVGPGLPGLADTFTLKDVANITEVPAKEQGLLYLRCLPSDFRKTVESIKESLLAYLNGLPTLRPSDVLKYKLSLSPVPFLLVSVYEKNKLLGTITVFIGVEVLPVLRCSERLDEYVTLIKESMLNYSFNASGDLMMLPALIGGNITTMHLGDS